MLTARRTRLADGRVAKGDQASCLDEVDAATRAKLYGVVLRILRRSDLADEVLQETYLKIWNSAGTFDPKLASPITWMVAIARNRALDLIRKKTEASLEDEPAAMEAAGEEPNPLARREMTEELRRLLGCPRPACRKIDAAWCCSPTTAAGAVEQLSAKFDAPANTIKTWLRRSLMEIRECLGS